MCGRILGLAKLGETAMQLDTGLDKHQIENLKREAKRLRKQLKIAHSAALDILAERHGYKNWSLLEKAFNRTAQQFTVTPPVGTVRGPTEARLQQACVEFIKTLDDRTVEWACKGSSSFWAPARRIEDGTFEGIQMLGIASDTMTRRYAQEEGLILLVDFSGLGDHLIFEGDEDYQEDDDGNPIQPERGELFTPKLGRELLTSLAFGDEFDGVMERLERFLDPSFGY
jgi:hypothetical protein